MDQHKGTGGHVIDDKWTKRFLSLARQVSTWSKDPSTRVGAVVADQYNRVVSTGYNGYPRGTSDEVYDREEKLRRTLHAEMNAILFAQRDLKGCTMYVTHAPCAHCMTAIVQCGLKRVVHLPMSDAFVERWGDDLRAALRLAGEAGLLVYAVEA